MLRIGTIIDIDEALGKGIIIDGNLQEIPFDLEGRFTSADLGVWVVFKIHLSDDGLTAYDIEYR